MKGWLQKYDVNNNLAQENQYNIDYIGKQIGIKKNGGIIPKAKDGNSLQLINFTKPTAKNWLSKYE